MARVAADANRARILDHDEVTLDDTFSHRYAHDLTNTYRRAVSRFSVPFTPLSLMACDSTGKIAAFG